MPIRPKKNQRISVTTLLRRTCIKVPHIKTDTCVRLIILHEEWPRSDIYFCECPRRRNAILWIALLPLLHLELQLDVLERRADFVVESVVDEHRATDRQE